MSAHILFFILLFLPPFGEALRPYVEVVPTFRTLHAPPFPPLHNRFPSKGIAKDVVGIKGGAIILTTTPSELVRFSSSGSNASSIGGFAQMRVGRPNTTSIPVHIERLVVFGGQVVAAVSNSSVFGFTCSQLTCAFTGGNVTLRFGAVSAVVASDPDFVWVASSEGLFRVTMSSGQTLKALSGSVTSVSFSGVLDVVSAGNQEKLWFLDPPKGAVRRWEWVTNVQTGEGGVIDNAVTALSFSGDSNLFFVGNPGPAVNVRDRSGSYRRVGPEDGLPVGNVTSMAASARSIWVGTRHGVVLWQWQPAEEEGGGEEEEEESSSSSSTFKYLNGPRWLADSDVRALARVVRATEDATGGAVDGGKAGGGLDTIVLVGASGGVTVLEQQEWTLSRKAEHFQSILDGRHDRHGMTAECYLDHDGRSPSPSSSPPPPFPACTSRDSDNNGLWTSLVVVAGYLKAAVLSREGEEAAAAAALASASRFFNGLVLLNRVTAKQGLMARSCCSPKELAKGTCAAGGGSVHDKEHWVNSTDPGHAGWLWKADTSSDETTGHVFALSVVAKLSPVASDRQTAASLLTDFVAGVVEPPLPYELVDYTGNATTWGRWSPPYVNGYRGFSDERGLQSLQMLSYLSAAANVSTTTAAAGAAGSSADGNRGDRGINGWGPSFPYGKAAAYLTSDTNQYLSNLMNLKIQSPCDDNYSDDELSFLPFYTLLTTCFPEGSWLGRGEGKEEEISSGCPIDRHTVLTALQRLYAVVQPERSALWAAITHAAGGLREGGRGGGGREQGGLAGRDAANDVSVAKADLLWNLRTWPLELLDWHVSNDARGDIVYDVEVTRQGATHVAQTKARPPLPANERRQLRWNSNPWDVSAGGSASQEGDPGAWLLPYWMARFHGLIDGMV